MVKNSQLQIRITERDKARLERLAAATGQDVSSYVLSRALPRDQERLVEIAVRLRDVDDWRFALAALHDFLLELAPADFDLALGSLDVTRASPVAQNYAAALVEAAACDKGVGAPAWTSRVAPLLEPHFATTLRSVRPYLLRVTPVVFKRRNIFTDAGYGARV